MFYFVYLRSFCKKATWFISPADLSHIIEENTTSLTPELMNGAKSFVELLCNDSKLADKEVYLNKDGESVTAIRLSVILAKQWLTDDVSWFAEHLVLSDDVHEF